MGHKRGRRREHVGHERGRKKVHVVTGEIKWDENAPEDVKRFQKIQLNNPIEFNLERPSHLAAIDKRAPLIEMRPETFLAVQPITEQTHSPKAHESLREATHTGNKVPATILDVDVRTGQVVGHEGRHRMLVAEEEGQQRVPVYVIPERQGHQLYPEEMNRLEKARFKRTVDRLQGTPEST